MEPNWGLYNSYYGGDRPPPVSPHQSRGDTPSGHRRSLNQGGFFPPPPPAQSSPGVTLPPVQTAYSSGYHGSSPSTAGGMTSATAPGPSPSPGVGGPPMHMASSMSYSSHMPPVSQPIGAYHYPVQSSPATMSSLPSGRGSQPHGYSPRITGGYPTASPAMTTLSPLSPSTHLAYPGPSSSTGSSSFPPTSMPSHAKMGGPIDKKRRTESAGSSWEGSGAVSASTTATDPKDRRDDDEQPWGMPQDQYKALNPRDKKQIRNRIGARRFRAKRKDYVSSLESEKKECDAKILQLQAELEASRREINDLRARLNMPPLPPPNVESGLGLVVGGGDSYGEGRGGDVSRRME